MELNRRNAQRAIIERAHQFVRTPAFEQLTLIAVKERLKLTRKPYEQLLQEHLTLVEGDVLPADLGEQNNYVANVEEIYLDTVERMQNKIEQFEHDRRPAVNPGNPIQNEPPNMAANDLRLEPMKLENFSGNYRQWSEWRALYDSLIHNNERLSATQKFHYMKRSLIGSAERVLSGWQITGDSYNEAYNTLVNVYDNRYRIVMSHLEEIMQLESCKMETIEGIRKLIDTTHRVLRQLNVMACPVQKWDNVIAFLFISRMAPRTLEAWETTQDLRDMPIFEDILKFLERRSRGILNLQKSQPGTSNNGSTERSNHSKQNNNRFKQQNPYPSASTTSLSCHNCQQPHPMHRCKRFSNLSLEERRNRVRELKLCFNCFKPTHTSNSLSCQFGECSRCPGKKHNSLLCPKNNSRSVNINLARSENAMSIPSQNTTANQLQTLENHASMFVPPNQTQNF